MILGDMLDQVSRKGHPVHFLMDGDQVALNQRGKCPSSWVFGQTAA